MKTIILFLCALMYACGGGGSDAGPRGQKTFQIIIDSQTVSPANAELVLQAVDNWHAYGIDLSTNVGQCQPDDPGDGKICVLQESQALIDQQTGQPNAGDVTNAQSGAWIFIRPNASIREIEHELGHGFGLIHTGLNTIMCANTGCMSEQIMPADYQQYLNSRL